MIRVLLADASSRIRANVALRLQREDDVLLVGTAKDGEDAVQEALRLQPDVALIDSELPGMDGVQTTEMLAQHLPATGVIMMSMEAENDVLRHAMLAGARELLQKPFSGDDLVTAVRRVHNFEQRKGSNIPEPIAAPANGDVATHESPAMGAYAGSASVSTGGEVITVLSGKGGVGKTVVAANLAAALAADGESRVVLVDLSLQFGDIAAILNLPVDRTIADLAAEDAVADANIIHETLIDGPGGIKVLLAPLSPELADYVTTPQLRVLMDELRRSFDYIVVDSPQHLNEVTLDAIEMGDRLVVLVDFSVAAIKDTRLVLSVIDVLKIDESRITVVANHHRGLGKSLDKAAVQGHLGHKITLELPYDPDPVDASINQGLPFVVSFPNSAISKQVIALASRVRADEAASAEERAEERSKKKQRRILGFARG